MFMYSAFVHWDNQIGIQRIRNVFIIIIINIIITLSLMGTMMPIPWFWVHCYSLLVTGVTKSFREKTEHVIS